MRAFVRAVVLAVALIVALPAIAYAGEGSGRYILGRPTLAVTVTGGPAGVAPTTLSGSRPPHSASVLVDA